MGLKNLFRHPIQAIESLAHSKVGGLFAALVAQLEAQNPGVKIAVDGVEQILHDHLGAAVAQAVEHVAENPPASVTAVQVTVNPPAAAAAPSSPVPAAPEASPVPLSTAPPTPPSK
jgi:hypothetical protein